MLPIFWDVNGPIWVHFQEKGQTVTCARYSDVLVYKMKPAIRSKHQGLLSKRVLLLHDARQHTAAHSVGTLHALKYTIQSGLGAIGLSLVWTYKRTFAGPEVCRWRGNGGGTKLVKGHAKKLFPRGHLQAGGQVDQVCCEAVGLCQKIRHKQFL